MPSVHDREEARSSLNIAWYVLHIFNICLTNKHFHMNFVCIVLHFKIIMDVRARLWIVCYCCCFSSSPLLLIFLGIFCRLLPSHVSRQDIGLLSGTKTLSTNAYHIILLSLTHIIWLYIAKKKGNTALLWYLSHHTVIRNFLTHWNADCVWKMQSNSTTS